MNYPQAGRALQALRRLVADHFLTQYVEIIRTRQGTYITTLQTVLLDNYLESRRGLRQNAEITIKSDKNNLPNREIINQIPPPPGLTYE